MIRRMVRRMASHGKVLQALSFYQCHAGDLGPIETWGGTIPIVDNSAKGLLDVVGRQLKSTGCPAWQDDVTTACSGRPSRLTFAVSDAGGDIRAVITSSGSVLQQRCFEEQVPIDCLQHQGGPRGVDSAQDDRLHIRAVWLATHIL